MRIQDHASYDPARVHTFNRTVFRDHPQPAEIHLAAHAFHQRFRAGNDRRDLKWMLKEPLEKQGTHGIEIFVRRLQVVQ